MKLHPNWLRTTEPTPRIEKEKPVRHGIPPQECSACHDYFIPANGAQVYCTAPNCVRDRDRRRQQERRRLQQMMVESERKKQQYDRMAKEQMAGVKRAFRETKGRTA